MRSVIVKCVYNTRRICAEEISFRIDSLEPECIEQTELHEKGAVGIVFFSVQYNPSVMSAQDIIDVLAGDVHKVTITLEA